RARPTEAAIDVISEPVAAQAVGVGIGVGRVEADRSVGGGSVEVGPGISEEPRGGHSPRREGAQVKEAARAVPVRDRSADDVVVEGYTSTGLDGNIAAGSSGDLKQLRQQAITVAPDVEGLVCPVEAKAQTRQSRQRNEIALLRGTLFGNAKTELAQFGGFG